MKVGIDLGGSHIAIGVVNNKGKIIEKFEKRILNNEKKHIEKTIENNIFEHIKDLSTKYKIEEIGIAAPGTIQDGKIIKAYNLGIEEYNIVAKLSKEIKVPIKIKNDAKCAAIAEHKYGCLKEYKRSIFLTLGTGIGGAVIINNKLLDAGNLPGCEFGHMIIEKDGLLCGCGKFGCWQQYASMKALKNNLRKKLGYDEQTDSKQLLNLLRNIKTNDKDFSEINNIIEEYIEDLSIGISNLINIFEPEVIGIGGSFVYFKDVLLDKLENKLLKDNLLFNSRKEIKIETAILENDAGIIGAVL